MGSDYFESQEEMISNAKKAFPELVLAIIVKSEIQSLIKTSELAMESN